MRVKASVPSPKYGWEDVSRNSIGVIHSLEDNGDMGVAFCFRSKAFSCSMADMEKVRPFELGEKIHVMSSISQPRLGWSNETAASIGTIARIDMDGTLNVSANSFSVVSKVFFPCYFGEPDHVRAYFFCPIVSEDSICGPVNISYSRDISHS